MSSMNFLTVKSTLSEFKPGSDKDTASESGTTTSVTSADELQKFALILGFNSVEDVYQEKFRIDRRRLEVMLADTLEETQTAHGFFNRIMDETNTLIKWPTRLKIGARSKKDPHVRVAGRVENVKLAREKIMQLLDTRSNRVTMKIDVSYTDHSHIIGKGGLTIKRVMEETGCHIHFPDSNRTSAIEKSNQVSIAGDMERVERARARVRALTPLVFSFELPIVSGSPQQLDVNTPAIQQIQEQYNVQVMIRNRSKLHSNLLVVKGVQWEVQAAMEATSLLMNYMCGNLASQTLVQMSMEISAMHHGVVVGQNAAQLRGIMKATNTQIMFPDADDPNIPAIKKSCVTITGQIQNVYAARQQLIGSLPLVVIFDVPEDACHVDQEIANALMLKHKVLISIRRKSKQGITSVVMKGIERNAAELYEARRELLGGNESSIAAEIPESYNVPFASNTMPNFTQFNPFSPQHVNSPVSMGSPYMPTIVDVNYASPVMGAGNNCYAAPLSPLTAPQYGGRWSAPSPPVSAYFPTMAAPLHNYATWNPLNGGDGPSSLQPNYPVHQMESKPLTLNQILSCSTNSSSGYQSNFSSCASLEVHNTTGNGSSNLGSPAVSPISKATTNSPAPSNENDRSQQELANIIQETPISERKAPGCELKTLVNKMSPKSDYRKMKAEANKAMQAEIGNGYRVPNTRWSGYYFSHTSPGPIQINEEGNNDMPVKTWSPALGRPNIALPVSPPCQANKPCKYEELYELLTHLSLQKYIDLFKKHELDLNTFATLSEDDLITMGVTAMGARKKMLMMMKEVKLVKQRDFQEDMKSFKEKLRNMMDQM